MLEKETTPNKVSQNSGLSDKQCHPQLPKSIQQKTYNWNKTHIGQLRTDVAKKYCSNTYK